MAFVLVLDCPTSSQEFLSLQLQPSLRDLFKTYISRNEGFSSDGLGPCGELGQSRRRPRGSGLSEEAATVEPLLIFLLLDASGIASSRKSAKSRRDREDGISHSVGKEHAEKEQGLEGESQGNDDARLSTVTLEDNRPNRISISDAVTRVHAMVQHLFAEENCLQRRRPWYVQPMDRDLFAAGADQMNRGFFAGINWLLKAITTVQ